ncbi:hypothetical protein [Streptomyces fumanus]|uniref:Uncharacterized protein n=1 Tax=Streptomyces fumanus TaxID=67302 RepID=A0A919A635_9ACTN|nr:hypothetical protein [Streptomyces fumanus]GHE89517.1 hypothetical protein GCM10018772_11650 [Streptomyces fumanus]
MAHAAPVSSGATPDVFGPRAHLVAKWALPVVLGLIFGFWAAANRRYGGPITGWNLLFGWLCALVFVVAYAVVREVARRLPCERHAMLWAAFTGVATGFLISQSPYVSLLRAVIPALAAALGVFVMLFYRYYTRADMADRHVT